MYQSPEPLDSNVSREHELQRYHVVYLVKRPAYEFIFAVPKTPPLLSSAKQAFFQVHFRPQNEPQGIILTLDELQDFYESVSQLMDYVQLERERYQGRF
jgi:hypothetical protein